MVDHASEILNGNTNLLTILNDQLETKSIGFFVYQSRRVAAFYQTFFDRIGRRRRALGAGAAAPRREVRAARSAPSSGSALSPKTDMQLRCPKTINFVGKRDAICSHKFSVCFIGEKSLRTGSRMFSWPDSRIMVDTQWAVQMHFQPSL